MDIEQKTVIQDGRHELEVNKTSLFLPETNISLNDKNWFQTGGPTRFFCTPKSIKEFSLALTYAQENNLEIMLLGKGANILVSDKGFDGLIISPAIKQIYSSPNEDYVTVESGASIQEAIDWCLDNNFVGLEEFSGIPGTIGGASCMNIHYFSFGLNDFLAYAQIINNKTLEIKTVDVSWLEFGYDESKLQEREWSLLSATFKVRHVTEKESIYAKGRRDEIIRHRNNRYPRSHTCGSFFKNFTQEELLRAEKTIPYVAYYLDKLGFKGELKHGGAIVSRQHANMIVNQNNATSQDIVSLARTMQERVAEVFKLLPQPECQFIGFDEYPLHKTNPYPH